MITANWVVFGTAWRELTALKDNLRNMANLTESLVAHGFQYQTCVGRYAATDEQSLAVAVHSMEVAKQIARHVGAVYQQECVGVLHVESNTFSLLYPSGKLEPMGQFQPVSEAEAFRADASTYWMGQYWIATQEVEPRL